MTLVARFQFGNLPLYIGDTLLTKDEPSTKVVTLVGQQDLNALLASDTKFSVTGARQKLFTFDNGPSQTTIAWAGLVRQASRVIEALVEAAPSTEDEALDAIFSVPETDRNELGIIGTILELIGADQVKRTNFEYGFVKTHKVGELDLTVSGTGAPWLLETSPQLIGPVLSPANTGLQTGDYAYRSGVALGTFLNAAGGLTGFNVTSRWGGPVEIVYFYAGRLDRLSNILYLCFEVFNDSGKARLRNINFFVAHRYVDGRLVVSVVDQMAGKTSIEATILQSLLVQDPIPVSTPSEALSWVSFAHDKIGVFVQIDPALSTVPSLLFMMNGSNAADMVSVEVEGFHVTVEFSARFKQQLREQVQAVLTVPLA
ncbi:MAG: hypothetical protein Q7T08_10635 [Devosia sp.]|nr:hypothetical protein [Devosia sp.]